MCSSDLLEINGGKLVYSLDDPYIHLALARHIAAFHYGINVGEAAAPASSILYPFLLAAFVPFGAEEFAPLVVNALALAATVVIVVEIVARLGLDADDGPIWPSVALVSLVAVGINLTGLVFTGLEHSLHVMTCLAVLLGLIVVAEDRRVPAWLLAALIVGPLLRYEGAAVALAGAVALAWLGRWRVGVAVVVIVAAMLAGFSLFLLSLGLSALPSSVLVKSAVAAAGADLSASGLANAILYTLSRLPPAGWLIGLLALAISMKLPFIVRENVRAPQVAVGLFALVVAAAHMMVGRYGWFYRFEIYALSVMLLAALYVYALALREMARRDGSLRAQLVVALPLVLVAFIYSRGTLDTPLSANNIYEQQYQMHRFVRDFYARPVAVNDLGWVAYRNPNYVLDLWGLGYEPARVARFASDVDAAAGRPRRPWVEQLVAARPVDLAIVYDEWFADMVPPGWTRVARLWRSHSHLTGNASVAFYAASPGAVADISVALQRFENALPPELRLELLAAR